VPLLVVVCESTKFRLKEFELRMFPTKSRETDGIHDSMIR
jgi:hypothetical protein